MILQTLVTGGREQKVCIPRRKVPSFVGAQGGFFQEQTAKVPGSLVSRETKVLTSTIGRGHSGKDPSHML